MELHILARDWSLVHAFGDRIWLHGGQCIPGVDKKWDERMPLAQRLPLDSLVTSCHLECLTDHILGFSFTILTLVIGW